MDQKLSRPVRWASATNRATAAVWKLQELRDQLLETCEELEGEWTDARNKLNDALSDLIYLQSEYALMNEPENLSESRFHQKRRRVEELNFDAMCDSVPDLKEALRSLKNFNPVDDADFIVLDEAKTVDLPKGYGRDK